MRTWRGSLSIVLAVAAAVFILLGALLLYSRTAILDSDSFADRATATLAEGEVQEALAEPVVNAIVDSGPAELINAQPIIEAGVSAMIGSSAFREIFHGAARVAHAGVVSGTTDALALNIADAGIVAIQAIRSISPETAAQIPANLEPDLIEITESEGALTVAQIADEVRSESIVAPLLGLGLLILSITIAPDRRSGFVRSVSAVAIAAGIGLIALLISRSVLLGQFPEETVREAVSIGWGAFFGDLMIWLGGLAAAGVILAAAALAGIREIDPLVPLRAVRSAGSWRPARPALRLGRAAGLVVLGLALIVRPDLALYVIVVAAGGWALFIAATEVILVVAPPPARSSGPGRARMASRLRPGRTGGVVAALVLVAAVAIFVADSRPDEAAHGRQSGPITACNGYEVLCDRPLDRVAFPATHNSMSAAREPGWFLPNQRYGIARQLEDGVRALLIDTHHGIETESGLVITDFSRGGETRETIAEQAGEDGLERIERIRARVAGDADPEDSRPFLCHAACELGATELTEALTDIRRFLDEHPDEVVLLVIEDVVPPEEVEPAFRESDLLEYAFTHRRTEPLPSLREMIEIDKRALIMGESHSGGTARPWYHEAFALVQETPYTFHSVEEISERSSCRPNRGTEHSPIFQINNWVEEIPRSPDTAAEVNSFDSLVERLRTCARTRRMMPAIIAVDHYDRGDLFEVVNVLNGLGRDAEPGAGG